MAQSPQSPAGPGPATGADPGGDPSMEDILASIRRILSEEEQGGEAKPPLPDDAAPSHDILMLNEDMIVSDPVPEHPAEFASGTAVEHVRDFTPQPVHDPLPQAARPMSGLVAPEAAQAAASSLGALARTLAQERGTAVRTGGPTIEDLVREEIRPVLKQWLDAHLPPLVERLVRAEIARVVGQANL